MYCTFSIVICGCHLNGLAIVECVLTLFVLESAMRLSDARGPVQCNLEELSMKQLVQVLGQSEDPVHPMGIYKIGYAVSIHITVLIKVSEHTDAEKYFCVLKVLRKLFWEHLLFREPLNTGVRDKKSNVVSKPLLNFVQTAGLPSSR